MADGAAYLGSLLLAPGAELLAGRCLGVLGQNVRRGLNGARRHPQQTYVDVLLSLWTWGEVGGHLDLAIPQAEFVANYFGAVIADLA